MDIRKIRFRSSGGFAGLVRGVELNADELTPDERSALGRQLAHPEVARANEARDLLQYELEAETAAGTRRLSFDEMNVPADLADLVQRLAGRAKPMRP